MRFRSSPHAIAALLLFSGLVATTLFSCDDGSGAGAEGADTGDLEDSTASVLCDYSQDVQNDDESVNAASIAEWSCDTSNRYLVANGIPDHEVGTFPNDQNPNAIAAQDLDITFPLFPEIASETGTDTRTVAYALNGVKFEVGTGGTCDDDGNCDPGGNGGMWRMEAVGATSFDFGNDESHGHVQPGGTYHYHGIPEGYLDKLGKGVAVTLVGWAVDGFPIYARYGYLDADDPSSEVVEMEGSYPLKDEPDAGRPSVDVYPMGAFLQDYVYEQGYGDLDECNGRFGVTPEFPDGIYHYYLTDTFPFGQRCVKGTAEASDMPEGPPPGG